MHRTSTNVSIRVNWPPEEDDVNVTNELTIQVPPLDTTVGGDGSRPGETSFSLQVSVTQDSSCIYFITDPGNNEAIVLEGSVSVSGGNSASVPVTGLTPNTLYNCSVVALSDYPTTQKQISVTTLPSFPVLTAFQLQSTLSTNPNTTFADVVANLDRPGSVLFHLEAIDDPDYVREDVEAVISQQDLDNPLGWSGYAHRFLELVGSKTYKCVCDAVLDVYGNEKPNGTEFQFTTDPPITVNATLTPPALPQGRSSLISRVNANKACAVELVLIRSSGEVYTQNYTQTGPGIVPRTFDGLLPDTLYTLNATVSGLPGDEATTVISATTLPPQLEITASLSTPSENTGTSLVANFVTNRDASVSLTLTAEGETYEQKIQDGTQSFVFQGLTPSTLYTLTAVATADSDGSEASALPGDEATTVVSATTLPPQLEITASLSTPSENAGTSLVANFAVSRSASVSLTLTAEGETYEQETQDGTQSFVFQGLTPSTLYTLTAVATADSDGSEATATDTRSTLTSPSSPVLISVDLTSTVDNERPPVSDSTPTDDGHIVPLPGQYGPWNAILTQNGQQIYERNNLLDGNQEETSIGVVINSNGAQHYTYGYYEGGNKTNVGEDIIGLATPAGTGSLIECYFTGLDDSKRYTVRMFGQHLNRTGFGSINFAKLGVNGDKKDTDPDTATCTWYAVAPSGGRIDFTLEYINPENSNEYASLGGFQLQEEVN